MRKNLLALAAVLSCACITANAGSFDGLYVTGGLSTSSASDTVTSAAASESGKTLTLGLGYAMPVLSDHVTLAIVGEATVGFDSASTKSFAASIQPGYYVNDDVVIYGKLGVVSESRSTDTLSGVSFGGGVKFQIAPNTFLGGEIEQIKFKAPTVSTTGVTYNLKDTRLSAKLGYVF